METQFADLVRTLESRPELKGKRLAQVPALAASRYRFRRAFYHHADVAFGLAIFNIVLASAEAYPLWPLAVASAVLMVWLMLFAEGKARAMTRQLHRRAAEQMARDLMGIPG